MGLLDLFKPARITQSSAPDISHFERRDMPDTIIGADLRAVRDTGFIDTGNPTAQQQRVAYRSLIYTFAELRAQATSRAMLRATVERRQGQDEWKEVEPTHPWVVLMQDPCPHLPALEFWRWVQLAKDLSKGAFLWVQRDSRNLPIALHPIYPVYGTMHPVPALQGGIEAWVYERMDGQRFRVETADVVWIRHASPVSPYESVSLLEAAAYESDTSLYQSIYQKQSFAGGGVPRSQIVTTIEYNKEQIQRIKEMLDSANDLLREGKVPFMPRGMEYKPVAVSAQDLQFVETARLTRETIELIFQVPEGLFRGSSNRATAEAAKYTFADICVQPQADQTAAQLTHAMKEAFAVVSGVELALRASDVIPLDPDMVLRRDEVHLRTGQRTINELRLRDGYDGFGRSGDVPLVSFSVQSLDSATASELPAESGRAGKPRPRSRYAEALQRIEGTDDESEWSSREEERSALWRAIESSRKREESRLRSYVVDLFSRQEEQVLEAMRGQERSTSPVLVAESVFDLAYWMQEMRNELSPILAQALRGGYANGAALASYNGTLDLTRPTVASALESILENQLEINRTTAKRLAATLQEGIDLRETMDKLVQRVQEEMTTAKAKRARTIARTAATSAFGAGQTAAFTDAGVYEKEWLSQRDGSVRLTHVAADGQRVGVHESFLVGGESLQHPGDPEGSPDEVVLCRCSMLPVFKE